MTPPRLLLLFAFSALHLHQLCYAIYDPRATTVKPPQRREPVLPWYLRDDINLSPPEAPDLSRKRHDAHEDSTSKYPTVRSNTKSWSSWKSIPGSDIEQRTEISSDLIKPVNEDQVEDSPLEFGQVEQKENTGLPFKLSTDSQRKEDCTKHGDQKGGCEDRDEQEFYEGLSGDNAKPHKEKSVASKEPKSTMARYDPEYGVQCPDFDSTGQFIYPPDCKFFVNCWKGRAFIQPCAPGTLFNPDTLECDYPYKVKCYGESLRHGPTKYVDASGTPKCPPQLTGMLPHPWNCTKYLQCANGGTFIRDCGPGTVFNPAVSVCDWPRNVKGCEDTFETEEDNKHTPPEIPNSHKPGHSGDHNGKDKDRKVKCPADYSGLLPHPHTCKKFLQCANGITYVMDCGPGTAFNPLTSVCDWPYNVPGCANDKPILATTTTTKPWTAEDWTTMKPWTAEDQKTSRPWKPHDSTPETTPSYWTRPTTTAPDWHTNLRPTWRPSSRPGNQWTTARPYPDYSTHYPTNENHGQHTSSPNYPGHHVPSATTNHEFDSQTNTDQTSTNQRPTGTTEHHHHHGHHHNHHGQGRHSENGHGHGHGHNHNHNHGRGHHGRQWPLDSSDYPVYTSPDGTETRQPQPNYYQPAAQGFPANTPEGNEGINHGQTVTVLPWENRVHTVLPTTYRTTWITPTPSLLPVVFNQQGVLTTPSPLWDEDSTATWYGKFGEWSSRTNVHQQNVANKEEDAKFDQWASRTNIFLNSRGQSQAGTKNNQPKPMYPNGIYVNVNGTRGHFITKEIEVNQGHSQTRNYGLTNGANQPDEQTTRRTNDGPLNRFEPIEKPSVFLEPPYPEERPNSPGHFHGNGQRPVHPQMPTDLAGSGTDSRPMVAPPSIVLEPPPPPPPPRIWNGTFYYPRVPVILPPPYAAYPYPQVTTPVPSVSIPYPNKPATHLQPPFPPYRNPRMDTPEPAKPSIHLEPPFYECPPEAPNCNSRGNPKPPNVPSIYLEPPLEESFSPKITTASPLVDHSKPPIELLPPDYDSLEQSVVPGQSSDKVKVPSIILEPPLLEPEQTTVLPPTTSTERHPDKHIIIPMRRHDVQGPKRRSFNVTTTTSPSIPPVTTEVEKTTKDREPLELPEVVEPDVDHDVDVLDEKGGWKPVLVFENKTQQTTTTESSVIMKINKKKVDIELFNIQAAPFADEEPPFPTYYVPPVQPLTYSGKPPTRTPISGQVVRLRGGSGPHEGYVEVQGTNPGWGIVCDSRNNWTLKEAHVVCRQLGYTRGAEMAWQGRNTKKDIPDWIAANSVQCSGTEAKFQSCKFTHEPVCRVERDAIGVRCVPNSVAHCHKDEIPHDGECYHLANSEAAVTHAEALQYCTQRNSRLLDIVSQQENNFISEWLLQLHPEIGSIMTSGVAFTTLNRTLWVWEDSSNAKFRFTKWWPGWTNDKQLPPWVGNRPACIVMKRKFPCQDRPDSVCLSDYFFWDTEDCTASMKGHSYICERPYDDIGCVYGKGHLYAGTANVTTSGKDCLPWADQRVAHPLTVIVVNKEVREKLKTHNYCRNPNPNKESRPWCFTGSFGERDYCDIPPCGNIVGPKKLHLSGQCKPRHFECLPGECIPSHWVCDGEADCTNGADEKACSAHLSLFKKTARHRLKGYDVEKWLDTPLRACAHRCKEADFTCRSFSHKESENVCLLSNSNVGMTGALVPSKDYDYYEMTQRSVNCDNMYLCRNGKCVDQAKVCNGKNDCNDRSDEDVCTVENLDYAIRLAGSDNDYEGRVEVKILGVWGQVCDDGFGMINAEVICKELGFTLGALELRPGGFYGNLDPPTRFMVDQLKCRGNETSLRECDFDGWGVHNCQPDEAVGVVCKTAVDTCQDGHWKCDGTPVCIPVPFICDGVDDCPDGSDESSQHCDAPFEIRLVNGSSPLQGRVEVRHHGIWGTVCDDDFSNKNAAVICKSLGYAAGAVAKKDGYFGPGEGPIWLDEVFCHGNETQLYRCEHNQWGRHNCDHNEDVGVICSSEDVNSKVNGNIPKWRRA